MTSEPLIWIVGSGGLLGSHMESAMRRRLPSARFWKSHLLHFSWADPIRLAEELSQAAAKFAATVRAQGNTWIVLWCAGKGAMNSPRATLEPEWLAWNRLLDQLATLSSHLPGCIFLASSAGGVYGGNVSELLTEDTFRDQTQSTARTNFAWKNPCGTGPVRFQPVLASSVEYRRFTVRDRICAKLRDLYHTCRAV